MPVISGGGGGGNTTAQVTASGKVLPVADASGVTVDTTTYNDTIKGSGKLTTLVFAADQGSLAMAIAGDAFPRWLFSADATSYGLLMGDGTADPTGTGLHIAEFGMSNNGDGTRSALVGGGNGGVNVGALDTNRGHTVSLVGLPLEFAGGGTIASSGAGSPTVGGNVGDLHVRVDSGTLILYRCTVAGTAGNATWVPFAQPGSPVGIVTSGALSTVQLVTATGAQILTTRDAETITPCTFNPGAATTATVTVALSPDNVTYSTLGVETEPAGVAFDGTIHLIKARVPAGWYLKLTVNAQATLGLTTYY